MIPVLLFFILSVCLFLNYRQTIIFIVVFYTLISAFSLWGQDLSTFVITLAVILFPFNFGKNIYYINKFPFKTPFLLLAISVCISTILAIEHHYPTMIVYIIKQILLIVIAWLVYMSSPQYILRLFVKFAYIFGVIVAVYSLFETITGYNPYIELVNSLRIYTETSIITEVRFGIKRSQGLFDVHVTNACVALSMLLIIYYAHKNFLLKSKTKLLILLLLVLTVFFSGARSAMVGFVVALPCFIENKYVRPHYIILFILIFLLLVDTTYFTDVYNSIVYSNEVAIGSSQDMRNNQFGLAMYFMNQSPIFGHGIGFTSEVKNFSMEILGAESLWLPVMIEQGLFGCVCYLLLFISSIWYFYRIRQIKLCFYILSFWIFNTMSSIHNCYPTYILFYAYLVSEMNKSVKECLPENKE